jgi:hypothetical protein
MNLEILGKACRCELENKHLRISGLDIDGKTTSLGLLLNLSPRPGGTPRRDEATRKDEI